MCTDSSVMILTPDGFMKLRFGPSQRFQNVFLPVQECPRFEVQWAKWKYAFISYNWNLSKLSECIRGVNIKNELSVLFCVFRENALWIQKQARLTFKLLNWHIHKCNKTMNLHF